MTEEGPRNEDEVVKRLREEILRELDNYLHSRMRKLWAMCAARRYRLGFNFGPEVNDVIEDITEAAMGTRNPDPGGAVMRAIEEIADLPEEDT